MLFTLTIINIHIIYTHLELLAAQRLRAARNMIQYFESFPSLPAVGLGVWIGSESTINISIYISKYVCMYIYIYI